MYQLPIFNEAVLEAESAEGRTPLAPRLLGLKVLVSMNCSTPWDLTVQKSIPCNKTETSPEPSCCVKHECWGTEWPDFLEPVFILGLHICCAYAFKTFRAYRNAANSVTQQMKQRQVK